MSSVLTSLELEGYKGLLSLPIPYMFFFQRILQEQLLGAQDSKPELPHFAS